MSRDWELHLGNAVVMPRKHWGPLFGAADLNQEKLREATGIAKKMVLAALIGLRKTEQHMTALPLGSLSKPAAHPEDVREVFVTLAKYFSLSPTHRDYRRYLGGMITVFEQIREGLFAPYDLVVFHPDTLDQVGIEGYVTSRGASVSQPASPIRRTFGFTDQDDHLPWTGLSERGRIHVSVNVINSRRPQHDAEELARILVHEASHRFARTHDVLYKHKSWKSQHGKGELDTDQYQTIQPKINLRMVPGKSITPMAGFDATLNQIEDVRFLENADSYAWAARRLLRKYQP